jgi:hypothetical protein
MAAMECISRGALVSVVSAAAACPMPAGFPLKSIRVASGRITTALHSASSRQTKSIANGLVRAQSPSQTSNESVAVAGITDFKHVLFPILDRNPYLSEATRQAAATTTALATKYGADITVVVIDEDKSESTEDHEVRMKNIRWHMSEGGFQEFKLMERIGEGKRPAAVIGEVADDMGLDLVILSMEAIHSKHIDSNLLAEFVPCPVLLLPL